MDMFDPYCMRPYPVAATAEEHAANQTYDRVVRATSACAMGVVGFVYLVLMGGFFG